MKSLQTLTFTLSIIFLLLFSHQQPVQALSYQSENFGRAYTLTRSYPFTPDDEVPGLSFVGRYPLSSLFYTPTNTRVFVYISSLPNTTSDIGNIMFSSTKYLNNWSDPLAWYIKYDENEFNQVISPIIQNPSYEKLKYNVSQFPNRNTSTTKITKLTTLSTFGVTINTQFYYQKAQITRLFIAEEKLMYSKNDHDIVFYSYYFTDTSETTISYEGSIRLEARNFDLGVKTSLHFTRPLGIIFVVFPFLLSAWLIYDIVISPQQKRKYYQYQEN